MDAGSRKENATKQKALEFSLCKFTVKIDRKKVMRKILLAAMLSFGCASASAAPMLEIKGLKPAEGCIHDAKAVTERLVTCPIGGARIRIWCPNGKVFDRDGPGLGVAIARSICEMNQLP